MRLRMRRRKTFQFVLKVLAALIIVLIYYFLRSKSKTTTIERVPDLKTKVFVVENENDLWSMWNNLTEKMKFSSPSGTLISISSHYNNGFYFMPNFQNQEFTSINEMFDFIKTIKLQTISSALTELFEKIIWIYPMWLPDNNIFTSKTQIMGINNSNLCLCSFNSNYNRTNNTFCENIFPLASGPIHEDSCQLLNYRWELQSMQEIYALVNIDQINLPSPFFININLDFFTFENPKNLSIDKAVKERIEMLLNLIFCPNDRSDESIFDNFFHQLITHFQFSSLDWLLKSMELPTDLLCHSQMMSLKTFIHQLIKELKKLGKTQLKDLISNGICFRDKIYTESSKHNRIEICAGYDQPESISNSKTHIHPGMNVEFHLQIDKIINIFKSMKKRPAVISIIRSTRTGFVLPKNQNFLEQSLLSNLKSIYRLQQSDIIYDKNLLGGAKGWWLRHENYSSDAPFSHVTEDHEDTFL